jgi:hypothetical protein
MIFQQIFNALTLRERFLVALIVWVLLLVWLLGFLESFQSSFSTLSLNRDLRSSYEATLTQADVAESLLDSARAGLDGSKTFSAAQLVGKLDSLARENKISSFDISTPSTQETQLFSFHNVRFSIKQAQIGELIRFDAATKQFSPYIALSDFQLSANKRDPRYLDAVFELVSFELKEDALNDE